MSNNNETLIELFGEPISVYTRAQAIADGVLVDVSERAKRYAIRFPVALTDGLYSVLTERADTEALEQLCVDLLLITMRQKITAASETDRIDFAVKLPHLPAIAVYALCTPGDSPAPVITVMLPHEDYQAFRATAPYNVAQPSTFKTQNTKELETS